MTRLITSSHLLAFGIFCACLLPANAAPTKLANPDLTKGDTVPKNAVHDWTLGATGARGWMYSNRLETTEARQIAITSVAQGSPADGVLKPGDVILGVSGVPFSYDPRVEFGKALTVAESDAGGGKLTLTLWRNGTSKEVVVELPVLGTYSATAPHDCPKSRRILQLGCKALAKRIAAPDYKGNPITRSLNALALLASGEPEYLPLVKKEAEWAAGYSTEHMATWYYGYVISLLGEYVIATGDKSVLPGLERLALQAANGQSAVGSWGHKLAGPDGRLFGYGMMNAPGVPLTISLVLARKAGVENPELDLAIERSAKLLRFYIGKGAVPYGDHAPFMQAHEDNGKCGMAAVLFNLLDEPEGAKFFSHMSVASHGAERDTGHTGNFWNMTWAMPGVALSGPQATGAWMQEFGAWYFDLTRGWDGAFRHQGPPGNGFDHTPRWDATGAYLLAYAMPLKKIMLTGKHPSVFPPLDATEAEQIVSVGRGWSNQNPTKAYDQLDTDTLIKHLASWSPIVRQRVARALAQRKDAPVKQIIELLDSPNINTRLGACEALAKLGARSAPAVPKLRQTLKADELWLRIKAADALAAIGKPAMVAVPELLEMLSRGPTVQDPRGMEQRFLSFALFKERRGLLANSLDGVDRDQLIKAVRAGLSNEDGRARSSFRTVYDNLSLDELKPLLPAISQAIAEPSPSGIMFADGIRMAGLKLFSKHHISEGIELLAYYARYQKRHASQQRIVYIMEMLMPYGAHAQRVIPQLEETIHYFENDEPDFPKHMSLKKAQVVRKAVEAIKASDKRPELISIKE